MSKKPVKKRHVKTAQKQERYLSPATKVLVFVGKPFFFILTEVTAFLAFLINIPGEIIHNAKKIKSLNRVRVQKQKKAVSGKTNMPLSTWVRLEWLKLWLIEVSLADKVKRFLSGIKTYLKKAFTIKRKALLFLVVLLGLLTYFYFGIIRDLPSPKELTEREPEVSTKIYDRNGVLLYKIYKDKNRTIVPLTEIPNHVRMATLAAEDAEFYNHPGFSLKGIIRAIGQDLRSNSLQGGSTITQQLVKNVLLSPERTLTRKIRELILSIGVETNYTKDQILEMYLNEVSYGGTAYGIESASELYFGKSVRELSIAEAAFLAGLPKSPTTYSPFGQSPEVAFEREKEVLHLMKVNRFISQETENQALSESIHLVPNRTEIKAPHFVMYVRQILVDKYGEDVVEKGGLEVTTSLDINIQEMSEQVVKSEVDKLKGLNVGNGAALVINPQTGEILAMVGSKNYFDTPGDGQVNVLLRLRQPGSSIKLINYVYALEHGYSPASVIDDTPIRYSIPGSPPYSPVNYDGKFIGKVSLRSSFAQSRNIPAVKILASYGVDKMIEQGEKMGITTWDEPGVYGLSLTLGGGAVKAIDLAKAYAVVANQGKKPEMLPILSVQNYKGKMLEKTSPVSTQVVDPRVAFMVTDILKDNNARAPEFGFNSFLVVKNHPEVAVKTGTSNDLRDNWTVGYSQSYLVLTWVGNNNNAPMSRIASGVTGASPIWNKILTTLLSETSSVDWKAPDGISKINICQATGTLPCDGCPTRQEWFFDESKPRRYCSQPSPTPTPTINPILDTGAKTESRPGRRRN